MEDEATKEVIQHGIDSIDDYKGQDIEASELHYHLYNEDYFIIGTYQAKEFLAEKVDGGVFDAIEKIRQYEQDNFGEVNTDFSDPEKVVNMYAYIVGEEALSECKTLQDNWDKKLTDKQLDKIKAELEEQL